ncbi:nuclear transport factor 2 family protein [Kribbella deserti]|uniref:Nuclear transport factor 2 family protein n=1 Tax=Kribbella deserti TaxID=1926257 RepID=A0ABV6QCX8_9ACTN
MNNAVAVATEYFDALAAKDYAKVAGFFADDLVWHQPGANQFSGTHQGADAVNAMIGAMMGVSQGTFALSVRAPLMANGDLVAASVRFTGQRDGATLNGDGIDLLRIADGKIVEAWLFTEDQDAENAFWG